MEEKKVGDYDKNLSLVWDGDAWIDCYTAIMYKVPYSGRIVTSYPEFKVLEYESVEKGDEKE